MSERDDDAPEEPREGPARSRFTRRTRRRRRLSAELRRQFANERQMAFIAGPRQSGKTTVAASLRPTLLLNWDDPDARRTILAGSAAIARAAGLDRIADALPVIVFDELHKAPRWRSLVKGFFDAHGERCRIVVTGSSRVDTFRRGGDSLMGRYFLHRLHPFTAGELARQSPCDELVRAPRRIADADWKALLVHGGFPEPFVRRDSRFSARWRRLRHEQLVRGDVRDMTGVEQLDQLDLLARLLAAGSASQLGYSSLASQIRVSVDTIRRWLVVLESLHAGFRVRPWFRDVARSLRKEPKWYTRDWSGIADRGARTETLVANHLLAAVEAWTDAGLGEFELRYLRDKDGREVDFAVIRDGDPWFLVEAKTSEEPPSPALARFQKQTGAAHAFQVTLDLPPVTGSAFTRKDPCIVPARSFLTQLP